MIDAYASLDDTELAIAAALAGASVVRKGHGQRLARIDKGHGDFATAADVAAEKAILDLIRAARPGPATRCSAKRAGSRDLSTSNVSGWWTPCAER